VFGRAAAVRQAPGPWLRTTSRVDQRVPCGVSDARRTKTEVNPPDRPTGNFRLAAPCPGWKPHRRDLLDPPKCGEGAWPWPVSCRIRSRSLRTTSGRKFDCPPARDIEVARVLDRGSGDRPRSGRALIVVVEPADLRDRHRTPAPRRLHRAGPGRILLQRLMGSHRVVQVDNQIPIGSSPEKSDIRGTRGTAVPYGLIRLSSGVGGRCSGADLNWARNSDRSKCRNGCSMRPAAIGCAWGRSPP
jgi:hypothetical protein